MKTMRISIFLQDFQCSFLGEFLAFLHFWVAADICFTATYEYTRKKENKSAVYLENDRKKLKEFLLFSGKTAEEILLSFCRSHLHHRKRGKSGVKNLGTCMGVLYEQGLLLFAPRNRVHVDSMTQ